MLSYEDCLGVSQLDQEAIDTLVQTECLPGIVALEYGQWLDEHQQLLGLLEHHLQRAERRHDRLRAMQLRALTTRLRQQATSWAPTAAPLSLLENSAGVHRSRPKL